MKKTVALFAGVIFLSGYVRAQEVKNINLQAAFDLTRQPATYLVDVRSVAEYVLVGHPTMAVNIPLSFWDERQGNLMANDNFLQDLKRRFNPDDTLIFMCRTGGRSLRAAQSALSAGYAKVYNIIEGFEGQNDEKGYRTRGGWKNSGLPYTYEVNAKLAYQPQTPSTAR
jgi:rhodanese-related sulfurtransferase